MPSIPNAPLQPELRPALLVGAIMILIAAGYMLNAQFQWKRLSIRHATAIGLVVFCLGVGVIAFAVLRSM